MKVVLKSDSELLDEVMVVAYGTAKKSSYAGSASLVKADALKDIPTTSFENALNGKVAGLQLTNNSGQAGSAPAIRIRGIGSMNAGNEPLYVVDGVPVSSGNTGQMSGELYSTNNIMNTLNPEDIESISVLKDAAASSLYGSRAANGVILITTKKGQIGKPVVTLKAEVGFTPCWATDNYETASVQENVNMLYTVFHDARTSGKGETDEKAAAYAIGQLNSRFNKHGYQFTTNGTGAYENVNILEYDNSGRGGKYYDWDKAYFRTAIYQTYDMSVSGATQNTNYYTSLSYTQDEGRLKMNSFDRVSGRLNLTQKVRKFLELTTNASLARTKKSGYNDTRNTGSNYFMQTRNLLWGLYWPTDYKTGELWTERYGSYAYNGLYYDKEWENGSTSTKIMAAETLTLHLMPGLDLRSIYSYDNTAVKDHIYYSANHYKGSADNGNVNEYRTTYEKMGYLHYRQLYRHLRQTHSWHHGGFRSGEEQDRLCACHRKQSCGQHHSYSFYCRNADFCRIFLGKPRWCPCSPSWIIITMNATSFPVLTAATVLPGSASRNVGETSGQWRERGTSCARVL